MNLRLWVARSSGSRRRQAGSTLRNVYLTKCRSAMSPEHRALRSAPEMRIALVSPYSWTYPGGVTGHIEALSAELRRTGHDVSVLAPVDPDDRLSARLHRGARPQVRELPEWLVPLGR